MTDQFGTPTKVNRHTLRAVEYLSAVEGYQFIPLEEILYRVKYTMRNLNPVRDLENFIKESLDNMVYMKLLVKYDDAYVGYGLNMENTDNSDNTDNTDNSDNTDTE